MQKANNIFHSFLATHRKELKKAIYDYEYSFNTTDDRVLRFVSGVQYATCIIRLMPYLLTVKRTEDVNVTELLNTISFIKPGIMLLYENDLMYEGLYDEIIDFIDLDIITRFNFDSNKSLDDPLIQALYNRDARKSVKNNLTI